MPRRATSPRRMPRRRPPRDDQVSIARAHSGGTRSRLACPDERRRRRPGADDGRRCGMRKAWLASLGVAAAVGGALFVGAAAATTGAPVFYDARYPAPASTDTGGYDVSEGADGGS